MNSTHKLFFSFIAVCMLGAFVQSSYAGDMGEKEKKGEEDRQVVRLNTKQVLLGKKVKDGDIIKFEPIITIEVGERHYVSSDKEGEMNLGFTKDDFVTGQKLYSKAILSFFGTEENMLVAQAAVREYKESQRPYQKNPGAFAFLVGAASVTLTAAASMFFK